ncbi:MAG: sugar phosphate nucleotidyltransferase [Bacteroidota bacterium]|nr:sugar phosphate nucleotidyltransferase [Bacteroidota bacterium]
MGGNVPVVILCGGKGLRLLPYSSDFPKALIPIGDMPVLWHVMKLFSAYHYRRFILAIGHRGDEIIDWFLRFRERRCDFTLSFAGPGDRRFHKQLPEDERQWEITFVHTGEETETGGRLRRVLPYIDGEHVLATYADGLTDADIPSILRFHLDNGYHATLLSVYCRSRFGVLDCRDGLVSRFDEKPERILRVNGGFFAFHRSVLENIPGDEAVLETHVLPKLAEMGVLGAYEHNGFWHCLDTPKDLLHLRTLWASPSPPWKIW